MSFHYGVQPWQVEELTYAELNEYLIHLRKLQAQQTEGGA